jgi:hypothetical protein
MQKNSGSANVKLNGCNGCIPAQALPMLWLWQRGSCDLAPLPAVGVQGLSTHNRLDMIYYAVPQGLALGQAEPIP